MDPKLQVAQLVNCSFHKPESAIVERWTGKTVGREMLNRLPDGPEKQNLLTSHGICAPCCKTTFGEKRYARMFESMEEPLIDAKTTVKI